MATATLLFLLAARACAAEPPARRMALSAVVELAVSRSPAVEQSSERVREAQAGLSEAKLLAMPRLSAQSAVTRGDDSVYAFGSLLEQKRFGARNFAIDALNNPGYLTNVKTSLTLGIPLFTGFALTDRRELGRIQVAAAGAAEQASRQAARYQATEAYLRVLLGRALVADAHERVDSAGSELAEARRLRARGLVLGSDFYAAEALLGALEAAKIQADNELAASEAVLQVLLRSPRQPIEPIGSLEDAAYSTAPASALVEDALRARQDLRQATEAEAASAVLARRERLSVLPTVDAFATVETNTSDFGSNPSNRLVGARATLPLGDPAYFERAKRAAAAGRAATAGREALAQAAELEVRRRFQEYQAAADMLPVLRDSAEKANKSLELFRPLYREGRQSILDVLRAEESLMKARAAYQQDLFQAHAGYARLELAAGRFDSAAVGAIESRLGGRR